MKIMAGRVWGLFLILFITSCAGQRFMWQSPAEGSEVWGIVRLQGKAAGASDVRFYLDSIVEDNFLGQGLQDKSARFSLDWRTQNFPNGEYVIYAVAGQGGDNLSEPVSLKVMVNNRSRLEMIPPDVIKMTPQNDPAPPQLSPAFRAYWHDPAPLGEPVNSAGAEDSPFITPDGNTMYFWFTGDPAKDVHDQALDPLTGIYVAQKVGNAWQPPKRLYLQYYDELALDGAHTVWRDTLWFASARAGNLKDIDMWAAKWVDGSWAAWENLGQKLNLEYVVGEMHITSNGKELYFDSIRPDGMGGKDIWVSHLEGGVWGPPELMTAVSSEMDEGWPFITEDQNELWFTGIYGSPAIFRSVKIGGEWGPPELVLSPLAGEPTLDRAGNLYFIHHRWDEINQRVSEADIYVCYRK